MRIRDEKHRKFIASLPCVISAAVNCQAAHIRHGQSGGMGLKPCDSLCVPLSWFEHNRQHSMPEKEFWVEYGIENAISLAKKLYENTGNREKCMEMIKSFRMGVDLEY